LSLELLTLQLLAVVVLEVVLLLVQTELIVHLVLYLFAAEVAAEVLAIQHMMVGLALLEQMLMVEEILVGEQMEIKVEQEQVVVVAVLLVLVQLFTVWVLAAAVQVDLVVTVLVMQAALLLLPLLEQYKVVLVYLVMAQVEILVITDNFPLMVKPQQQTLEMAEAVQVVHQPMVVKQVAMVVLVTV
jgi:hypothetical protein